MAAVLVLVGCGGKPASKPETLSDTKAPAANTPTAAAPAPKKETLNVKMAFGGSRGSIVYLPPVFAESSGFYAEEAIKMTMSDMQGGPQAIQALVSGEVDFASAAVEHAAKAKAQGVDLVMVALYARYPGLTLVVDSKLKDRVKSISDLKGLKIGVSSPGSSTHKALISMMNKFGLKNTDYEAVGVGIDGMPAALESGKIQAAVGVDPYVTKVVTSGKAFVLWDLRTKKDTEALYGGEYPLVGLVTRRELVEKNPEMVQRVVNAIVKSNKFISSGAAESVTAKVPAELKGADEALYLSSLRSNVEVISPDGLVSDKGLQTVIDSLKADKVIPDNVTITPADIFNGTFARNVK
jgi:NitT/TauT family transport system substrate-binding protein